MTRGATARLFVAVDLPTDVRGVLVRWARAVTPSVRESGGQLRLLAAESLHVTLCFLGSRPAGEVDAIAQAVTSGWTQAVGEISLGAPLWLPTRRPRALAVELHDDATGSLQALHDAVARGLTAMGAYEPDHRRFRPHVTVARMRSGQAPRERELPATPQLEFVPDALVLYRSWLGPTEASYEALASCALAVPEAW